MAEWKHDGGGNCLLGSGLCSDCGFGNNCDICHEHDQPRGECDECPACAECEREQA